MRADSSSRGEWKNKCMSCASYRGSGIGGWGLHHGGCDVNVVKAFWQWKGNPSEHIIECDVEIVIEMEIQSGFNLMCQTMMWQESQLCIPFTCSRCKWVRSPGCLTIPQIHHPVLNDAPDTSSYLVPLVFGSPSPCMIGQLLDIKSLIVFQNVHTHLNTTLTQSSGEKSLKQQKTMIMFITMFDMFISTFWAIEDANVHVINLFLDDVWALTTLATSISPFMSIKKI